MEVVESVRCYIAGWTSGGESECRAFVTPSHCNPSDPNSLDLLTTTYHTLLLSILSTWSPKHTISSPGFISFIKTVLNGLPSSSSKPLIPSTVVSNFGEHLVDMIWAVDAELDEILGDAKSTIGNCGDASAGNLAAPLARAKRAKQNAENDKEIIITIVKQLVDLGLVVPSFCIERLDTAISASVGLIPDKSSFDKKEIRTRTGLFYKQNKFNLLREQSEGYSKLTAELTSSLGPAHSSATGQPTESYASIEGRARPVWEKVISLIGYFDLDPNRALDMILDVLSIHLVAHHSFFLALLSFSPWSASYRRPLADTDGNMNVDPTPGLYKGKSIDEVLSLADHRPHDATTKGSSPRVMAQVVGFKFAYYQSPDVNEPTPKNLYLTAAILIREGFITLEDLYPHLSPSDADMDQVHKDYLADVQARIVGAKISALALAPPLPTEGLPSLPQTSAKTKAEAPEPKKTVEPKKVPNQKVGLLTALLAVGALKPAVAIMSKFPWLVNAHPEIADLMLRVLKLSISPLYDSLLVTKERNPSFNQPRARYGNTGVIQPSPRKPTLTLWAPTPPSTSTVDFVFFFPQWVERVPICSVLDDLVDVIEPLVAFIGVHISRDPLFLTKFLRLGRTHLQTTVPVDPTTRRPTGDPDPEDPVRLVWFSILRKYLLPALTLIRGNAVCTVEIWNIIRQYETTARWRLYGEWRSTMYKSHPELRVRKVHVEKESKSILRRLSHNTFDSLSGTVAKLAHSNPCIFFTNAVNQIMAYDNLANVVIQALRYVTNMGFDVLVFVILDALANPKKERVKDDGVNTTDWLQSLASFTGMLFRRYSADLTPLLKYIVHQLHNGQTTEIIVLRELIWKMAGIEPLPSLTDSQVIAMAGGPVLRIEAIASAARGARLDPGDANLKGPQRLGRSLLESSLALPLLIQVAQQRDSCVFRAPDAHLKTLASLYDTTHGVLLQYLELLTSPSVVAPQDYANKVLPSLAELGELYGICAPICMHILRPVLNAKLLAAAEAMQEQERIANEEAEKRLRAALTAKKPLISASRVASPGIGAAVTDSPTDPAAQTQDPASKEDTAMETESISPASVPPAPENPWLPELFPLFEDVKKIAPQSAYDIVGPAFYLSFWQLSTYDLTPPSAKYDDEVANLRNLSRQEDSLYNSADRSSDRSIRLTAVSHRHRRERYNSFATTLTQEFKQQTLLRAFTLKRLAREKQHWFSHSKCTATVLVGSIIEHCIQPRCLLSPMDADYCAQIIKVLHTQGTPGFYTLQCYNKILGDHVSVVLFSCSEYEARNYGRFLRGVLADLAKWHSDQTQYTTDSQTVNRGGVVYHPGFLQKWTSKPTTVQADQMEWGTAFRKVVRKWHRTLSKCFIECIKTGEFMRVYNTIIVLKEILPVFPLADISPDTGGLLNQAIEKFLETEERDNLKILGRAYSASLKKRESYWAKPKAAGGKSIGEKAKPAAAPPSAPSDARRTVAVSTPSAPRAQLANATVPVTEKPAVIPSTTSSAFASIQKPPVVKRVRDTAGTTADDAASSKDGTSTPSKLSTSRFSSPASSADVRVLAKDPPIAPGLSALGKEPPQSPRNQRALDEKGPAQPMPPPVAPSQTQVAQELRETAKQTMGRTKEEEKRAESRAQNGSRAPSPRRRSLSPSSRPGTRDHSSESRASGGRPSRGTGEPGVEDKRPDRDTRQEVRDHASALTRRDSLTHNRERGARERAIGDKDERDKDRNRDRHGDRDRERERDRDRDRDSRDRDRHRRDDVRKDRGGPAPSSSPAAVPEDRALPTRPDPRHNRNGLGEEGLGKRRRPADDDPERGSKRSSRKDGHRDDRSRRPLDKDGHERGRDSERRRKDREGSDNDGSSLEKIGDKRIPDGPSKVLPLSTPSAPRAMSSSDLARPGKSEPASVSRDRHRDNQNPLSIPVSGLNNRPPSPQEGQLTPSLRSRISEVPSRADYPFRPDPLMRRDDERDNRKRTASDRDPDGGSGPPELASQGQKRPKMALQRNRYGGPSGPASPNNTSLAKRTLPIDRRGKD
ncbi:transcription factor/nuclear export subunit protein 2-domain-containing protein [Mycena maculata]|uniref:THO complex subunit 2 n=1 Tax=Mycena maculata TaxID=230809 RepID=A0AAD7J3Z5_9AGAR|nr:transcription factor/nuclear export subunit protein 2-domain-containing protein [Mycena maculata]